MKILARLFICLFMLVSVLAVAQQDRHVRTWNVVSPLAVVDSIPVDTLFINFQDVNPIDRFSIANSFNGNLGSPIQTKLYFLRPQNSRFIFADAYFPYTVRPDNVVFYNTKTPFSSVQYLGAMMSGFRPEENVQFLFTANANRQLNFGTKWDYTRAFGEYADQATRRTSAQFFGSFDGERYSASGAFMINSMDNFENGGIRNLSDIHNPHLPNSQAIDTRLRGPGYSSFRYYAFVYNHSYSFGFNRTIEVSEDSTHIEFVPVTRFGHNITLSEARKRYREGLGLHGQNRVDTAFHRNTFFSPIATNDTAAVQSISNTFFVTIEEEFNRWMQFGLTAFLTNDVERYMMMADSASLMHEIWHRTRIGGVLSRQHGTHFRYNILAELDVIGVQAGDFNLTGNLDGFFRLWNDSITLSARGFMRNESPSFFLQRYNSNHFRWDNNFNRTYRTQVGGKFTIPTRRFALDVAMENISNLIYFDHNAMPAQDNGNVQIISANLRQDFHFGRFRLENNMFYQLSSNQDVLPLPTLAVHHNLYYLGTLANGVLGFQVGVDVRYFTAYYAPNFSPATGLFFVQDVNNRTRMGNFPVMNAYANFHLRTVRFFAKWYHFNSLFMENDFFTMPHFPINPAVARIGLSWNFYN